MSRRVSVGGRLRRIHVCAVALALAPAASGNLTSVLRSACGLLILPLRLAPAALYRLHAWDANTTVAHWASVLPSP